MREHPETSPKLRKGGEERDERDLAKYILFPTFQQKRKMLLLPPPLLKGPGDQ